PRSRCRAARPVRLYRRLLQSAAHPLRHRLHHPTAGRGEIRVNPVSTFPGEGQLAAPAGARPTMGLDPGYRTGVKVAVVTGTGQVAATTTIYPHEPRRRWDESIAQLAQLARGHRVELIAIGNGTASRETDRLGAELIR